MLETPALQSSVLVAGGTWHGPGLAFSPAIKTSAPPFSCSPGSSILSILAGMQSCPWCVLMEPPRGTKPCVPPWLQLPLSPKASALLSHCTEGLCSVFLMLLTIAVATNRDVVFAVAPFSQVPEEPLPLSAFS